MEHKITTFYFSKLAISDSSITFACNALVYDDDLPRPGIRRLIGTDIIPETNRNVEDINSDAKIYSGGFRPLIFLKYEEMQINCLKI